MAKRNQTEFRITFKVGDAVRVTTPKRTLTSTNTGRPKIGTGKNSKDPKTDCRCAAPCPRIRRNPPGPQTREHHAGSRRRALRDGLRPSPTGSGRTDDDRRGEDFGHPSIHVAGAGTRRSPPCRSPHGCVLVRRHVVRTTDRRTTVPRQRANAAAPDPSRRCSQPPQAGWCGSA